MGTRRGLWGGSSVKIVLQPMITPMRRYHSIQVEGIKINNKKTKTNVNPGDEKEIMAYDLTVIGPRYRWLENMNWCSKLKWFRIEVSGLDDLISSENPVGSTIAKAILSLSRGTSCSWFKLFTNILEAAQAAPCLQQKPFQSYKIA